MMHQDHWYENSLLNYHYGEKVIYDKKKSGDLKSSDIS